MVKTPTPRMTCTVLTGEQTEAETGCVLLKDSDTLGLPGGFQAQVSRCLNPDSFPASVVSARHGAGQWLGRSGVVTGDRATGHVKCSG